MIYDLDRPDGRTVGGYRFEAPTAKTETARPAGSATEGSSCGLERHSLGAADRSAVERDAFEVPAVPDVPSLVPALERERLQSSQLAMLLDGIDLSRVRRPKHWVPPHPSPHQGESLISTGRWYQAPKTTTVRGGPKPSGSRRSSPRSSESPLGRPASPSGAVRRRTAYSRCAARRRAGVVQRAGPAKRRPRSQSGAQPFWTSLRFPGQYYDAETDLFQN